MFWESDNAVAKIQRMAATYRLEGNFAQAKSLYACLIPMIKKEFGPECKQLALNFFRLAETYNDGGNLQAAKTYYNRATELWTHIHKQNIENPLWYGQAMHTMQIESEAEEAKAEAGEFEGQEGAA